MDTERRYQLITFIQLRLHRYEQWRLPEDVLDEEMSSNCQQLLELLGPHPDDIEAMHAVALAFWYRAILRPSEISEDLTQSVRLFEAILPVAPQLVPDLLLAAFEARESETKPTVVSAYELERLVLNRFQEALEERNAESITQCIELMEKLLGRIPRENELKVRIPSHIGSMYYARSDISGSADDLDSAVSWCLLGARSGRPEHLLLLSQVLDSRHRRSRDPVDLDVAIKACWRSLDPPGQDEKSMATQRLHLAELPTRRHSERKHFDDLNEAVCLARDVCASVANVETLIALRDALQLRVDSEGSSGDIDEIIGLDIRILDLVRGDELQEIRELFMFFHALLQQRDLAGGDLSEELAAVVVRLRELVVDGDAARPVHALRLLLLALVIGKQSLGNDGPDGLPEAQGLLDQADGLAIGDQALQELLGLARRLVDVIIYERGGTKVAALWREAREKTDAYARTKHLGQLNSAIALGLKAHELSEPGDEKGHEGNIYMLAHSLLTRHELTENSEDVNLALFLLEELLGRSPTEDLKTMAVHAHSMALYARYRIEGSASDLDASIAESRDLVDGSSDPNERRFPLNSLARSLWARYELSGDPVDAERALACFREALDRTSGDDPSYAVLAGNLGAALADFCVLPRDMAQLCESIELLELAAGQAEDPFGGLAHLRLGEALIRRHLHTNRSGDLNRATDVLERGLAMTPVWHDRHRQLSRQLRKVRSLLAVYQRQLERFLPPHLREPGEILDASDGDDASFETGWRRAHLESRRLQERFDSEGNISDLDRAIELSRAAVAEVPEGDPGLNDASLALATQLLLRFWAGQGDSSHDASRLDEAIEIYRRLLASVPSEGSFRISCELSLAAALGTRYRISGEIESLNEAILLHSRLTSNEDLRSTIRVHCSRQAGRLLAQHGEWARAMAFLELAVNLHSRIALEEPSTEDRLHELSLRVGVAGDAAACALEIGDVERALRLLERARGVLDVREDELDMGDLLALAEEGPIVVLTMSPSRCDAILLTSSGPIQMSLSDVDVEALVRWSIELHMAADNAGNGSLSTGERRAMQRRCVEALGDLWDKITGPVLDQLGISGSQGDGDPPRIWWIPTGIFTWLPLHAAGHPDGPSVLDRVVSSYAPSLHALSQARTRIAHLPANAGLLAIAIPEILGRPELALPQAEGEADMLMRRFQNARILGTCRGAQAAATPERVLSELAGCGVVHIACHTQDNWRNPLASRLILEPGEPSERETLSVGEVAQLKLENACLAYLSACATARTATAWLHDEGLNLAAAFQRAGFPHIIGTLWAIDDQLAVEFASDCYEWMSPAPNALALQRAPYAVRLASVSLRDRFPTAPSLWASHVHLGP